MQPEIAITRGLRPRRIGAQIRAALVFGHAHAD
jgi:hypothetical protein